MKNGVIAISLAYPPAARKGECGKYRLVHRIKLTGEDEDSGY